MAKLESLIVDLQLNTAQMQKGLDEANTRLAAFDKQLKDLAGVVVFEKFAKMAATAVQSLASFTMRGAETADQMGKLAQSTGTTVESFSRMAYGAALGGVGAEELSSSMVKLDAALAKANAGGKEQAALFAALGIKVTDAAGKMRGADAVMGDLAERFAGMEDGAAKTKLAVDLFGKAGAELIPFLNGGRDGMAALAAEADRLGVTISSSASAAAEAFNDNLSKLQFAMNGVGQRAAAQLTPMLTALTDELLNSADGAEVLQGAAWALSTTLKSVVSVGVVVSAIFEAVGKTLARVASALVNVVSGRFGAAFDDLKGQFTDIGDAATKAGERIDKVWSEGEAPAKAARQTHGKTAQSIVANANAMAKAATEAEQAFKALEKVRQGYEEQAAGFGGTALDQLKGKLEKGELAVQLEKIGDKAEAMKQSILDAAAALEGLKDAKLANEQNFALEMGRAQTSAQVDERRTKFSRAGRTSTADYAGSIEGLRLDTAGFASFDAAVQALAEQTNENARLLALAEWQKVHGETESAQNSLRAADEAKRSADQAAKAADAFTALQANLVRAREKSIQEAAGADSWIDAMKRLSANFKAALGHMPDFGAELSVWWKRMGSQLASAGTQMLGAVGDLVNSIAQGAQAGGVWGALIAAFMEIAKRTASAMAFLDTAMQFVEELAAMVEPLVKPIFDALRGVLEIVADAVAPVIAALQPLFTALGGLIDDLSPVLFAVGDLFAALSPIIEFVGRDIARLLQFLKPVFEIIGGVVKAIASVVLGVLIGLNEIAAAVGDTKAAAEAKRLRAMVDDMWKSADKAKSNFTPRGDLTGDITATGKVTATGAIEMKGFDLSKYGLAPGPTDVIDIGGWGYAAGSIAGAEAARAFVEASAAINGATAEAAAALGQAAYDDFLGLGDAAGKAADKLNDFSSSLSNVPDGFRYAAAAFNSQDFGGAAPAGAGGDTYNVTVQGSILSELDLEGIVENVARRKRFRKTGAGG